jgi:hypothetical protein
MILYHQRGGVLMAQVVDKQEAHDLIDQMPAEQIPATISFLKSMLQAVVDDEPVTEEDKRRYHEAKAALNRPEKWTSMEEVLADFGLTVDDFPLKK